MKIVSLPEDPPESWQLSYTYDLLEIYGSTSRPGYRYAYQNRQRKTLDAIARISTPGAKILDLAAAQGNFTLALAECGYEVTWNDLREDLIDYVKLKHETGIIHYVAGNIFDLNLQNHFDIVLIAEVIEHVAHPDQFLQKVTSLVKPGGYVVMTTPNGAYFRNKLPRFSDCPDPSRFESEQFKPDGDGHIFLLHTDEVTSLSQDSSLRLLDIKLFNNSLTAGHIKLEWLLHALPKRLVDRIENATSRLPENISNKLNVHILAVFRKDNGSSVA